MRGGGRACFFVSFAVEFLWMQNKRALCARGGVGGHCPHSKSVPQSATKSLILRSAPLNIPLEASPRLYTPFSSFSLVAMKSPLFAIILLLLSALALFWTFFPPPLP